MPHSVTTLLTRNLRDVFGEGDAVKRRRAIDELFAEDAVFHAPDAVHRGRNAIDRIAGQIRAMHPDFRYTPTGPGEEICGGVGRVSWVSGPPDGTPAYAGTDIIVTRDGMITAVYLFFDRLPQIAR